MKIEEIIKEAKKRYPIGCKFRTAAKSSTQIAELKGHRFSPWINGTYIKAWQAIKEEDSSGLLYSDGIWAEIIEMPDGTKPIKQLTYEIY